MRSTFCNTTVYLGLWEMRCVCPQASVPAGPECNPDRPAPPWHYLASHPLSVPPKIDSPAQREASCCCWSTMQHCNTGHKALLHVCASSRPRWILLVVSLGYHAHCLARVATEPPVDIPHPSPLHCTRGPSATRDADPPPPHRPPPQDHGAVWGGGGGREPLTHPPHCTQRGGLGQRPSAQTQCGRRGGGSHRAASLPPRRPPSHLVGLPLASAGQRLARPQVSFVCSGDDC